MDFRDLDIWRYAEAHTETEPGGISEIARQTRLTSAYPQMLSGHIQGRLLSALSRMLRPMRILEIGTFTGYGTLCLAEGLAEGGRIDTIEKDSELENRLRQKFAASPISKRINLLMGDASDILATLNEPYDLIFIDADKVNYPHYLAEAQRLSHAGTWIIADNVLWGGKVADTSQRDPETMAIREFNRIVQDSARLRNLLLPLRDGLMLIEVVPE